MKEERKAEPARSIIKVAIDREKVERRTGFEEERKRREVEIGRRTNAMHDNGENNSHIGW